MDEWELTYEMYDKVTRKIRNKNKKMYELYNKAGADYKMVTFDYMKKLIKSEQVPTSFLDTYLTQLWKGKGSALDLNNMRFIHMRFWRSRLLEALVTENMKKDIVKACPNNQLGGMPGAMSVEHLVVLKTWMKQKEQQKQTRTNNNKQQQTTTNNNKQQQTTTANNNKQQQTTTNNNKQQQTTNNNKQQQTTTNKNKQQNN